MQQRDPDGVETSAIAALMSMDGKRVVDVGCGTGRLTSLAAAHAAAVYAFDPDGDSVAKAETSLSEELARRSASRSTTPRHSTFPGGASTWRSAGGRSDACHSR